MTDPVRAGAMMAAGCMALALMAAQVTAQRTDAFVQSRDHPAIVYSSSPTRDRIAALNDRLASGGLRLTRTPESGYLLAALEALGIPLASQSLVFSQTSLQASHIRPSNPRALYFDPTVAVGWVPGADHLEIAVQDERQGVIFYTLDQRAADPRFVRDNTCLSCHLSWETLGVPGLLMLTTFQMPDDPHAYAAGFAVDHRTPLPDRWGGWYVTGRPGTSRHRGNVPVVVPRAEVDPDPRPAPPLLSVAGRIDARYPTQCSDVAALMVLAHQVRMTNLITRAGWEARVSAHAASGNPADAMALPPRVATAVAELVDYMLFVDEAPLLQPIEGTCGFTEHFASLGPRDGRGRSLFELDLGRRLLRYPCSYMIHTPAFDALPHVVRQAVYAQLWEILSADDPAPRYAHLSGSDRLAIIEILRDTKDDLPDAFRQR